MARLTSTLCPACRTSFATTEDSCGRGHACCPECGLRFQTAHECAWDPETHEEICFAKPVPGRNAKVRAQTITNIMLWQLNADELARGGPQIALSAMLDDDVFELLKAYGELSYPNRERFERLCTTAEAFFGNP